MFSHGSRLVVLILAFVLSALQGPLVGLGKIVCYSTGDSETQLAFGRQYDDGLGVGKDVGRAVFWYTQSAAQGNAEAQLILGELYEEGRACESGPPGEVMWCESVPSNMESAVYWYRQAAKQGNSVATNKLDELSKRGFSLDEGR